MAHLGGSTCTFLKLFFMYDLFVQSLLIEVDIMSECCSWCQDSDLLSRSVMLPGILDACDKGYFSPFPRIPNTAVLYSCAGALVDDLTAHWRGQRWFLKILPLTIMLVFSALPLFAFIPANYIAKNSSKHMKRKLLEII